MNKEVTDKSLDTNVTSQVKDQLKYQSNKIKSD